MEFYHILNRGVEKKSVFLDDGDRQRFVHSLYVFNDTRPAPNAVSQTQSWLDVTRPRDKLIHLHAWCLMDNHYHLLISPVNDDVTRLSLFMKKLNMGYARFFNEKYDRSGYLWQGKYKKIHIVDNSQFLYIPYYVHLNPLDFDFSGWRRGTLKNTTDAIAFLDGYRWSSWLDYTGVKNFPSIIHKDSLEPALGTRERQIKEIQIIVSDALKSSESEIIEAN